MELHLVRRIVLVERETVPTIARAYALPFSWNTRLTLRPFSVYWLRETRASDSQRRQPISSKASFTNSGDDRTDSIFVSALVPIVLVRPTVSG